MWALVGIGIIIVLLLIILVLCMNRRSGATNRFCFQIPAPIIDDPSERGFDREYRTDEDPEDVVRIRQSYPNSMARLVEYIKVAGISRPEYEEKAIGFIAGKERRLELIRDPLNKHDGNAIKVVGYWKDYSGRSHFGQLGWVDREMAALVVREYPKGPLGATLKAMFIPSEDKGPGLRIDILRAKVKPERKKTTS